jgi:hypothetical protein
VWRWPTPTPALDHTLRGGQSHEQLVTLVFAQKPPSMAAISAPTSQASPSSLPPSVFTLPQTAQLEALYTIIRDKNTSRADFLFYSDRIIRLLVEEGLNHLPVLPKTVETPTVRSLHDAAACAAEHGVGRVVRWRRVRGQDLRRVHPQSRRGVWICLLLNN